MPRPKKSQTVLIQSLEELISDYDRPDLIRSLSLLQTDLSWKVFRAALMKEYLYTVAASLDKSAKTGTQIEAAYYAGAAQTMFDTANNLIEKYKDVLANKTAVTQEVRPEE